MLRAKPAGVARYVTRLVVSLPAKLKGVLPASRQIEADLSDTAKRLESSKMKKPSHRGKGAGDGE